MIIDPPPSAAPRGMVTGPLAEKHHDDALELVRRVFKEHVAPLFDIPGQESFLAYTRRSALQKRVAEGHLLFGAQVQGRLLGFMELRPPCHVAMLFIDTEAQRCGIGRSLLCEAATHCRQAGGAQLTVNASPNALAAYSRMGFFADAEERVCSGIRHTPMSLPLGSAILP